MENKQITIIASLALIAVLIVGWLFMYLFLPTNTTMVFLLLIIGTVATGFYAMGQKLVDPELGMSRPGLFKFFAVLLLLVLLILGAMILFVNFDRAKYFDDQLTYVENGELPFYTPVNGETLRVVDKELAHKIMDKSNVFGSNKAMQEIHIGNIAGKTYWIGAAVYDNLILSAENNQLHGFVAVDFTDPTKEAIIVNQTYQVGSSLIFGDDLNRIVWSFNRNYYAGDNIYYSMNDDNGEMELIVPYSIRDQLLFGNERGGLVTGDLLLDGGVLIINSKGDILEDYKDREQLPPHARIQTYSETWLETNIAQWGSRFNGEHNIDYWAAWFFARSPHRMGIDDDVRVVIDPDTGEYVQYILLESTGSDNELLRGAIKANSSGLFYYNWEEFSFIDTNAAKDHVNQAIVDVRGTNTHGYKTLLPILYPVKENVTSLTDYAYVVSLQLGESRFGGIAITDPSDKTGTRTVIEFAKSESLVDVPQTLNSAIQKYLALLSQGMNNASDQTGELTAHTIKSYVADGFTNYVIEGYFDILDQNITVLFTQQFINTDLDWLKVVTLEPLETLQITISSINGVWFAISV